MEHQPSGQTTRHELSQRLRRIRERNQEISRKDAEVYLKVDSKCVTARRWRRERERSEGKKQHPLECPSAEVVTQRSLVEIEGEMSDNVNKTTPKKAKPDSDLERTATNIKPEKVLPRHELSQRLRQVRERIQEIYPKDAEVYEKINSEGVIAQHPLECRTRKLTTQTRQVEIEGEASDTNLVQQEPQKSWRKILINLL